MPDPQVVQVMQEFKDQLLAQDDALMQRLTDEWLKVEQRLREEFALLAFEAAEAQRNGQPVTPQTLWQLERYQTLVYQVRAETSQFVNYASEQIESEQEKLAQQGMEHAIEALNAISTEMGMTGVAFNILPITAVNSMIGLIGNGSPLLSWLQRTVSPEAVQGMIDALIQGIALGTAPSKIAVEMANGFGLGLQRAMNTARTETLRAYRNASLMQYQDSGVVVGYRRLAKRDSRTCIGCLFTDGMMVESLDHFDEHNQGRCTMIPVVRGAEDASVFQTGTEWFLEQDEDTQRSILGPARFEAWQNGASLESMATLKTDPTWGNYYAPTPVSNFQ